ncbi:RNA-directed DNA polymerase [Tanacetum coccineum]
MSWNLKPSEQTSGDEFLEDEVTPGKVTILDKSKEQSDWDNDERSGGEILLELEWENPFAAKRGESHTIPYLSKEEENDDDLPYPKFQKFKKVAAQIINKHEEQAFPPTSEVESNRSYQPLHDSIMGPSVYPSAQKNPQPFYMPYYQFGYPQGKGKTFSGGYDEQDKAYKDLDRITCEETKNLWSFLEDFRQLAIKSGRLYFPSTPEKLFAKLLPSLYKKIEESLKAKYPGLNSGVLPAIKFTHTFILEMCKDATLAKELRDLSLCSAIPIPEENFAKDCRSKQGNIARSTAYQELDLDDNWDIISADFDDKSVYSISEGEGDTHQSISVMVQDTPVEEAAFMTIEESNESDSEQEEEDDQFIHYAFMFHPRLPTKIADMVQSAGSWKPNKELPTQSKECEHDWKKNTVTNYTICYYCGILTIDMSRLNCPRCQLTTCALCAKNYLGKTVNVKRKQPQKPEEEKDFSSNEVKLLKELLKEKTEQSNENLLVRDFIDALKIIEQLKSKKIRLEEQKDEEIRELKAQLQKEKEKHTQVQEEFSPLRNSQTARPCIEMEVHYSGNATASPKVRKITNQLYNVKVKFDITNCPTFGTTTIIDTGASTCCINKKVILEEALEPLTHIIFFNGLNSRQHATHRLKQGSFLIEVNKFKIPLIYAFDMRDSNGIEMLIGANFLRYMKRGIRIEGDEITIYKKVTRIKTSNKTEITEIAELEVSEEEFLEINESIYFNQEGSKIFLE